MHAQQQTTISGKVTDAATGDPLPFVNVFFKGTTAGVTTDFDGKFSLRSSSNKDTVSVSYIGYITRSKKIQRGKTQVVNFQLESSAKTTDEITVTPGENPAWEVMRRVVAHKEFNDKRALSAFEYESYNKIEIDIDNISEAVRKRKVMRRITQIFDSLGRSAGEDGKPILPLFISESISNFYWRSNPEKMREEIGKSRITGVGINEAGSVQQMIGSSFQQYNFYQNWLNILGKNFVSPLADSWKFHYSLELADSMFLGEDWCYRIKVEPKRPQDLAFTGTIWITKEDYALRSADLTIGTTANLNFVEKIKIQQELERTPAGAWLPRNNRIIIDVAELTKNSAGMLAKFYTSNRNFRLHDPKPVPFYDVGIELLPDAREESEAFWQEHRHDTLTATEKNVYKMIDTIRNVPVVKSYIEIANILVIGYKRVGKVEIGPYLMSYANNSVEGNRFRLGLRTNSLFSRKWNFEGWAAYGTKDGVFKRGLFASYIFTRKPWTQLGISQTYDLDQVALLDNNVASNPLFNASTRFGDISSARPFMHLENTMWLKTQLYKGLTSTFSLKNRKFDPLYNFSYRRNPDDITSVTNADFTVSEVIGELRYSSREYFMEDAANNQISVNSSRAPVFTFRYVHGLRNLVGGDFNYDKYNFSIAHNLNLGFMGTGRYVFDAGYIPNTLPYPLLKTQLGNQNVFYNSLSYNLMNMFEFVTDRWVSLGYQQNFEGLGLNSIPGIKKLKWRLVGTGKIMYGSISRNNLNMNTVAAADGTTRPPFRMLTGKPYIEVGYGIENIFKIFRVDFLHRLTYRDTPVDAARPVGRFGIKIGAQFKL
ncbi:MAG: DUF5686 family protein [Bacteroidota bacterium]